MLKAKLHAPALNKSIVSREPLLAKLQNALSCKLTLVMAPPGYGKTTAVLDWLSKCDLPCAWLSLDAGDNDSVTFWQYVFAALEGIAAGIGKDAEYVFRSRELLQANIHIHMLIDRLSEVPSDFLLVLDDIHLINDPVILTGLSSLIDYLPARMHLIFIGREEPELDLAKHRIKWQAQHLGEDDLRFRSQDISRFYRARGYDLAGEDLNMVESYTQGWAAAMVAVAMSMGNGDKSSAAIAVLTRSSRDIKQYLKNEVLGQWSPEKQAFAMQTSILATLSADLCDAVTGDNNAANMLREMGKGCGFLLALDEQKQEYRYHHLFRSLLRAMLQETSEELPRLHGRAGGWLAAQGRIPEAIDHFLDGGCYREASDLLEHRVDDLINKKEFGRLLAWVERLPQEYKESSFKVAAIYAVYHAETDRYDLSRQWIGRMKELRDHSLFAQNTEWEGYSRTVCTMVEANLLIRQGNADFFTYLFSAAQTDGGRYYKMPEYSDFNPADIFFYRCPIHALTGLFRADPDRYAQMTESYRAMITRNPGYAPLGIGEYLYESNRLEEALPYLLKAVEEARAANCPGALVPAMADIVRMKRAQGDIVGAFRVLEECERQLPRTGKPHWTYGLHALRCRLWMDIGDMEQVRQWLLGGKQGIFAELNRVREFELLVQARALMALGQLQDAELLLQRLLAFTGDSGRLHSRVEVLNLLALLAFRDHHALRAFRYLDEALDIGSREGYIRSFLDELSPMAQMLRAYNQSRRKLSDEHGLLERKAFASGLLKQLPAGLLQTVQAHDDVAQGMAEKALEPLTPQERKVLQLLVNASANQEISEKLGISLRTVKAHTGSIYSKLGLKNRTQCIKLVRELGLL